MLYSAEGLSHSDMSGLCCQAGVGVRLSRAFPLSPEFIVIHNGIITNYKDLQKFLVSDSWGVRPSLPPFSLPFALTPFPAHSPSCILTHFPFYIPHSPHSFIHVAPLISE